MYALLVKTIPTSSFAAFPVALQELFAVVIQNIVLARDIENVLGVSAFQDLIDGIELFWFREVTDVAGMQDELRCCGQSIDLVHRGLQSPSDIRIGRLVESPMVSLDFCEA